MDHEPSTHARKPRRYRIRMAEEGWTNLGTLVRREKLERLREVKRRHRLKSLHVALDLVLARGLAEARNDVSQPMPVPGVASDLGHRARA
jgi:hypothetical protein